MKKLQFLGISLAVLFVISYGATAQTAAMSINPNQANYNIGIVYSTGGLGDKSFNDAAKRGIESALAKHGNSLNVEESCTTECDTITKVTNAIITMGDRSDIDFDLIIGVGFSAADGINASAIDHPDQQYMIIDSVVDLPNVNSITFKENEGSFLTGALAAMVTQTDKIAFLGGLDIDLINRFLAGYAAGAKYINPNITVAATYSPDPSNPWGDIDGGKRIGDAYIQEGYDIIYAAAGGTGIGVINAVAEKNDAEGSTNYYAIGVDSNQDNESAGDVLTSMVKRVDVAVEGDINNIVNGNWTAGVTSLGLAENGVGITDMQYTQAEATADYNSTHTRMDVIDGIKQMIIDGKIDVPQFKDQVDIQSFNLPASGDTLPIPTGSILLGFFATIMAISIRRRRQ